MSFRGIELSSKTSGLKAGFIRMRKILDLGYSADPVEFKSALRVSVRIPAG
jgi:hypothetical protein